jgi:hypothetical protein
MAGRSVRRDTDPGPRGRVTATVWPRPHPARSTHPHQRYQRDRRPPTPSAVRTTKPSSQSTNTTIATYHRTCSAKPAPPRARAINRTSRTGNMAESSRSTIFGFPKNSRWLAVETWVIDRGSDAWPHGSAIASCPPPRNLPWWSRCGGTVAFGHVLVAGLRHGPLRCGVEGLGMVQPSG